LESWTSWDDVELYIRAKGERFVRVFEKSGNFLCAIDEIAKNLTGGESMRCLGLDIGGTKSAAIIGDAGGNILKRSAFPSKAERGAGAMIGRTKR
jgi:hypothetical protein